MLFVYLKHKSRMIEVVEIFFLETKILHLLLQTLDVLLVGLVCDRTLGRHDPIVSAYYNAVFGYNWRIAQSPGVIVVGDIYHRLLCVLVVLIVSVVDVLPFLVCRESICRLECNLVVACSRSVRFHELVVTLHLFAVRKRYSLFVSDDTLV